MPDTRQIHALSSIVENLTEISVAKSIAFSIGRIQSDLLMLCSQDLLVTQSEYVKVKLISLQAQVQDLENKATDIEKDIRAAMSKGNKESEEELMQKWFGLLNRKNEHIKKQIELNIM